MNPNGNNNRADGYSYSAAGNLLNDGLNRYVYDGANRILSVNNQATGYVYDAEGNRVAKLGSGGTVQTVYVLTAGNAQLDELNGSGGWNHTNIYAPGGRLLATYDSTTQPSPGYHYNLTDWLGTKRMQTTAGGNSQEICISNPYGDGLACTGGADATEQHFTGKDHDTESNLDYFGARYYSETFGRFMTPDWAAAPAAAPYASYGDPQSLNLYAYVKDDPIRLFDNDGHRVNESVTISYYSVSGSTAAEALNNAPQAAASAGIPGGNVGYTDSNMAIGHYSYTYTSQNSGSTTSVTETVSSADVNLSVHTTLPKWTGYSSASPADKHTWDVATEQLATHEAGHKAIAETGAHTLDKSIPGTSATGTGPDLPGAEASADSNVKKKLRNKLDAAAANIDSQQQLYDERTHHGEDQSSSSNSHN